MPTFDEQMNAIKTSLDAGGGQAFPGLLRIATPFADANGRQQVIDINYRGMSYRQHVASLMMAAFASNGWMPGVQRDATVPWDRVAAERAVAAADALIIALAPPPAPVEPKAEVEGIILLPG